MVRHKLGTFDDPIEITNSDDESQMLHSSEIVDLTHDDQPLRQKLSVLRAPSATNKDSSKSSAASSYSTSCELPHPLGLRQLALPDRRDIPSAVKNKPERSSRTISSNLPPTKDENLTGVEPHVLSDGETDSDIPEVMDGSAWRSRRRSKNHLSQTLEDVQTRMQTRRSATVLNLSPDPISLDDQKTLEEPSSEAAAACCPLLSAVVDILQSVKAEMKGEHAAYVNKQLRDALKKSQKLHTNLPYLVDATDPFAHMEPLIDIHKNTEFSDQVNTANRETSDYDAEASRRIDRLQPYKHYTTIRRSFLAPDRPKLYFEPYLGHDVNNDEISSRKWLERLKKLHDPSEDPQVSRHREQVSRLKEYIPRILKRLDLNREDIVSHMIDTGLVALGLPESTLERFLVAFKDVFEIDVEQLFPEYDEYFEALRKTRKKLEKGEDTKESDPIKDLLNPHLMSCPVCHVYLCGVHGIYETDSSEDEGPNERDKGSKDYADMNLTYGGVLSRHEARSARLQTSIDTIYDGKPCGEECFKLTAFSGEEISQWTSDDKTYLQVLLLGMENEPRASCILAPLMGRPCYNIRRFMTSMKTKASKYTLDEPRKGEKLDWYDNKCKKIRVDLDWGKKTTTHLHHKLGQPTGCEHLGKSCFDSGSECSCNEEGVLCNKFCSCPDDCYMKFTGCNCSKGNLPCSQESEKCPCKLLNRECDPDLCHDCGAKETVSPFSDSQGSLDGSCCNTDIQRGYWKRLIIGESSHPGNIGFGAYTAEPIKQGEFIAEYVGEIISNAECGRRSEVYDKLNMSFIFDLNDELAIDSYRYGNLTRFINHSIKNANCKPLVRLVVGDHRIGFFATKDLDAGVELFFNYGKNFTSKQELKEMDSTSKERKGAASKKVGETSNGKTNGAKDMGDIVKSAENVTVGADNQNLDEELFGNDRTYSFPNDDGGDEYRENAKKEHDMVRSSRRPRRNVQQPKRYTR